MNDKEKQEKSSYEKLRFLATLFVLCLSTMAWAQMKVTELNNYFLILIIVITIEEITEIALIIEENTVILYCLL